MKYHEIIHELDSFMHSHEKQIRKITEEEGLFYGQFPILACLIREGSLTQREISNYLQVSAPTVATSVKRLERTGAIKKYNCDEDMRRTIIEITEDGKKRTECCAKRFYELDKSIFSCLSEEEKQLFFELVIRLNHKMKEVVKND